jgi:hypothetical protein
MQAVRQAMAQAVRRLCQMQRMLSEMVVKADCQASYWTGRILDSDLDL